MRAIRSLLRVRGCFEKSHPESIPVANESIFPCRNTSAHRVGITSCSPASISSIGSSSTSAGGGRDTGIQIAEE
jgi:hypothetical protein